MVRPAFFGALVLFLIMAILPFRMNAFAEYGHPYAAAEQEFYFTALNDLERLKSAGGNPDALHQAMLKLARAATVLRQYKEATRLYRAVLKQREASQSAYDQTYISAILGLAGLLRDTANDFSAVSWYTAALSYDKKHLPADDSRIIRDKINLAVALLIAGNCAGSREKKLEYSKSALGFLQEAIADEKARNPQGSFREANARQTLAYVLKDMGDRDGYENEIRVARAMQRLHASFSHCLEP